MELEENEDIILDDAPLGFRKKLVLSNKRLFVKKGKGIFSVKKWVIEKEIPLTEIEEATQQMDTFTSMSHLIIKLKNQEKLTFNIGLTDSQILSAQLGDGDMMVVKVKAIIDKYVSAINHQIYKQTEDNPFKLLQIRFAKGEITKEEYEEMKKILEGHLNN